MEISFINVTFPLQKENLCLVFRVLPISAGSQWLQFKITHMSKRHILGLCIWVPSNMFMEVGHYYQFHYIPSSLYTFLDLTSYHGSTLRESKDTDTSFLRSLPSVYPFLLHIRRIFFYFFILFVRALPPIISFSSNRYLYSALFWD